MPFKTIADAKNESFPTKAEGIDLTLAQINQLAIIAEGDNPIDTAWAQWKKVYKKDGENWVKQETKKNSILYDIKSVPIFMTGRWKGQGSAVNGDVYTEQDFDEIVTAFKEIGNRVKPYMKLGHSDDQKMLQKDGYPAAGWITNLYRKGSELIADIAGIPKTIYDLIENKAYGRFSPEIVWNWEDTTSNKKYKRVITALALLGANTPACDSPNDFINLYGADIKYSDNNQDAKYYENKINNKENDMTIEELQKKFDAMELKLNSVGEQLKEKDNTIAELKKNDKVIEDAKADIVAKDKEIAEKDQKLSENETSLNEIKLNAKKEEIKNYLDKAETEGKITPAIKEYFSAIALIDLTGDKHEYSYKTDDDAEKKIEYKCTLDLVKGIVDNSVKSPDFEEKSVKGEIKKNTKSDGKVDDTIDNEVRKYCKENEMNPDKPEDYSMAFDAVSANMATKQAESRMENE